MAVHIRLTRVGATRRPSYRVIAIDSRRSRDGRALEILGYYDPLTDPITVKLDDERIANWVSRGALPSAAVQRLMKVAAEPPRPKRAPATAGTVTTQKPRRARPKKQVEPAPVDAEPTVEPEAPVEAEASVEAESPPEATPPTAEGDISADGDTGDSATEPEA